MVEIWGQRVGVGVANAINTFVISAKFGPRAGKAEISTRIRLADTQQVVAICELSDGSFWSDKVDVILTLSACLEDPV